MIWGSDDVQKARVKNAFHYLADAGIFRRLAYSYHQQALRLPHVKAENCQKCEEMKKAARSRLDKAMYLPNPRIPS